MTIYNYTYFDDRSNEAVHTMIIDNNVKTTREPRFEYGQRTKNQRNQQKDWSKSVHELGNTQRNNLLIFQPRNNVIQKSK